MQRILCSPALLLSLSLPASLQGQFGPPDTTTGPAKGATTFGIGVQTLDVAAFNATLAANGLPAMSETVMSTGLATEVRFGRWDLSFSGSGISGSEDEGGGWRTTSSGSALTFGGGFAPYDGTRWRVATMAGVGLTRITYHVEQVRGGSVDSVLADPLRGTDLNGQSWIWQAGLGIEYKLGKVMGQRMGIAGRVGIAEAFGDPDWRTDENDLSSGPRASYGGFYARIGIAMGMPKRQDAMIPALVSVIPWLGR